MKKSLIEVQKREIKPVQTTIKVNEENYLTAQYIHGLYGITINDAINIFLTQTALQQKLLIDCNAIKSTKRDLLKSIRTDEKMKNSARSLFISLSNCNNLTLAIDAFFQMTIQKKGFPFEIHLPNSANDIPAGLLTDDLLELLYSS